MCRCRLPLYLGPALLVAGEPETTIALPPCAETCFFLQFVVEFDRITQKFGNIGAGAELTNKASGVKGCARGKLLALK